MWMATLSCRGAEMVWRVARAHPLTVAVAIFAADAVLFKAHLPWPIEGVLDASAHLATAALVLAVLPAPPRAFLTTALLASVLIDLDHIPLYADWPAIIPAAPRPHSHSLATAAVSAGLSRLAGPRMRPVLSGIAYGVFLHLFRDVVTGPLPLFWPLSAGEIKLPYGLYALVVVIAALAVKASVWYSAAPRHRPIGHRL